MAYKHVHGVYLNKYHVLTVTVPLVYPRRDIRVVDENHQRSILIAHQGSAEDNVMNAYARLLSVLKITFVVWY